MTDQPPEPSPKLPAEQPIEVRICTGKALWFDMVFVVGTQGRIVEAAEGTWYGPGVREWMTDIAQQVPYTRMDVDREGSVDTLECYGIDDLRVRLVIRDDESACPYVDAVVSRRKLLWELYHDLQSQALRIYQASYRDLNYTPERAKVIFRSAIVEQAIDWPNTRKTLVITDDVTGLERADPLDIEEIRSRP